MGRDSWKTAKGFVCGQKFWIIFSALFFMLFIERKIPRLMLQMQFLFLSIFHISNFQQLLLSFGFALRRLFHFIRSTDQGHQVRPLFAQSITTIYRHCFVYTSHTCHCQMKAKLRFRPPPNTYCMLIQPNPDIWSHFEIHSIPCHPGAVYQTLFQRSLALSLCYWVFKYMRD